MKRTVYSLTMDLRAANAEAKDYLNRLHDIAEENTKLHGLLKSKQEALEGCDRMCGILLKALEYYQR